MSARSDSQRNMKSRLNARPHLELLEDRLAPATLLALTTTNSLLRFDSATPNMVNSTTAITGLNMSENVLGIDYRPANGLLYGVTNQNRVITINPMSGAITKSVALTADPTDGTAPFTTVSGTSFGVDFNPVPDRLRVVSNTNQNLRINVDTGRVITDGMLNDGTNPSTEAIVAAAYLNNFAGTTGTTLYDLGSANETLFTQNPPNNGTLVSVGAVGGTIDVSMATGFDIQTTGGPMTRTNTAYATLVDSGATGLYTVNLGTGAATFVNTIGDGTIATTGLAVVPAGTFNFQSASFGANENGGMVTITVTRTGGSLGAAQVDFAVTAGTATAGSDFTANAGMLMFADGETTKTFTVAILDDMLAEGNETVMLALSNATGETVIGARGNAVLTIRDNEGPSTKFFALFVNTATNTTNLAEFDSATPDKTRIIPILGLSMGEVVEGIDFRPADGKLYGLVVNGTSGRLITINTHTGATTRVANLTADPTDVSDPFMALTGSDFGFDFNPTNDRLRITSDTDINLLVNPNNGQVTTQATLNPATPNVVGSAYTNSFVGAGSTTLYALDSVTDELFIQNPPGAGTLVSVGLLGVDTSALVGFDIVPFNNQGFASLTPATGMTSQLAMIDLATGAATVIGTINTGGFAVNGLAAQPVNDVNLNANGKFVNRLFFDLLGRAPSSTVLTSLTASLNAGASRTAVVLSILNGTEFRGNMVDSLFQRLLRRPIDATNRAALVASGMTEEQLTAMIVGSAEYFQKNGGTNSMFVAALFRDLLKRTVDATSQAQFAAALGAGLSRQNLATSLIASSEFRTKQVQGFFLFHLRRSVSSAAAAPFVSLLNAGNSSNTVLAIILGSAEFFNLSA